MLFFSIVPQMGGEIKRGGKNFCRGRENRPTEVGRGGVLCGDHELGEIDYDLAGGIDEAFAIPVFRKR